MKSRVTIFRLNFVFYLNKIMLSIIQNILTIIYLCFPVPTSVSPSQKNETDGTELSVPEAPKVLKSLLHVLVYSTISINTTIEKYF